MQIATKLTGLLDSRPVVTRISARYYQPSFRRGGSSTCSRWRGRAGVLMKANNIPEPTVRRLSLYLRELETLWRSDHRTVSSRKLAQSLKFTATQIRKDLAYFGQFGQRGIGYDVGELITKI